MNRKLLISGLLALITLSLGGLLKQSASEDLQLKNYSKEVNDYIDHEFFEARSYSEQYALWIYEVSNDLNNSSYEWNQDSANYYNTTDWTAFLLRDSQIVFWSNNINAIDYEDLSHASSYEYHYAKVGSTHYLTTELPYRENGRLVVALPLKYDYKFDSDYVITSLTESDDIPKQIALTTEPTAYQVPCKTCVTPLYIEAKSSFIDTRRQKHELVLLILGLLFTVVFLDEGIRLLSKKNRLFGTVGIMICALGFVKLLTVFGITNQFTNLGVFANTFTINILGTSLAIVLLNLFIFLWFIVFLYREFDLRSLTNITKPYKYLITSAVYFSALIAILVVMTIIREITSDTELNLQFHNYRYMITPSFILSIITMILCVCCMVLAANRLLSLLNELKLRSGRRTILIIINTAVALPVFYFNTQPLPSVIFIDGMLAMAMLLFIDWMSTNNWRKSNKIVYGLIFYSVCIGLYIQYYIDSRDRKIMTEYSQILALENDSLAEKELDQLRKEISMDKKMSTFSAPFPIKTSRAELDAYLFNHYDEYAYLLQNFRFSFWAFNDNGTNQSFLDGSYRTKSEVVQRFLNGKAIASNQPTLLNENEEGFPVYQQVISIEHPEFPERSYKLFLEFAPKEKEYSEVYSELLVKNSYRNLKHLDHYDFVVLNRDQVIQQNNKALTFYFTHHKMPKPGEPPVIIKEGNRKLAFFQSPNGNSVIMEKVLPEKQAYFIMAFIFFVSFVIILLIDILNKKLPLLPKSVELNIIEFRTFEGKVQSAILGFILITFMAVGYITIEFYLRSTVEYHDDRLLRKSYGVINHLDMELREAFSEIENQQEEGIVPNIKALIDPFSEIHRMDINFYGNDGKLLFSSVDDLYLQGLAAPLMGSQAYAHLKDDDDKEYVQTERLGKLRYPVAYFRMQGANNRNLGYVGMPYFDKEKTLKNDLNDFITPLIILYFPLFYSAYLLAGYMNGWLSKPLKKITEHVKEFKLGAPSKPIDWTSKDEFGEFFAIYNNKLEELNEMAKRKVQYEKESLWRNMAKSVGHEIKNPAGAMQLHLQRIQQATEKGDTEKAFNIVHKTVPILREQIAVITKIANDFYTFSDMDKPSISQLSVADVFRKNAIYFSLEQNAHIEIVEVDPTLTVLADEIQLQQVMTNLIKNGIQACRPNERAHIIISAEVMKDRVSFFIKDNGTGIAPEKEDKVFLPKFTTKTSGSGLGLAICKNLIEDMDGFIKFETIWGSGTTFIVNLPKGSPTKIPKQPNSASKMIG